MKPSLDRIKSGQIAHCVELSIKQNQTLYECIKIWVELNELYRYADSKCRVLEPIFMFLGT